MDVNQLQLSSLVLLYDGSFYYRIYCTELMQESAAAARLIVFRAISFISRTQSGTVDRDCCTYERASSSIAISMRTYA